MQYYINQIYLDNSRKCFLQIFAKLLTEKMREVTLEKKKTQKAMHTFLPKTIVACDVKKKRVQGVEKTTHDYCIHFQHEIGFSKIFILDVTILKYLSFQVISESFESATVLYAEFMGIDEHITDISANEVDYIFELVVSSGVLRKYIQYTI